MALVDAFLFPPVFALAFDFAVLLELVPADFLFVLVEFDLAFLLLLLCLAWLGFALQCDLVLTPFLFTDDLRQVQLELDEHALDDNPLH